MGFWDAVGYIATKSVGAALGVDTRSVKDRFHSYDNLSFDELKRKFLSEGMPPEKNGIKIEGLIILLQMRNCRGHIRYTIEYLLEKGQELARNGHTTVLSDSPMDLVFGIEKN